jgi:pilus assembly protein CpaF
MSASPMFGRRRTEDLTPAARPAHAPAPAAPPPPLPQMAPPPSYTATSTSDSLAELRTLALQQLDPAAAAALPQDRLLPEIEKLVADIATERRIQLNAREQRQLANELVNDMLGLGPLQPLLDDESIADIMVNGPERVFVERQGRVTLSNVKFRDAQHVANICQRIASAIGRRIDESSPMVDARLMDGSRVNIVFPPLALDGPYVSIRKFTRKKIDFARLVALGSMTPQVARVMEIAGRARLNIIISGGTGSGKTTLMNALSRMIDPSERVITIEDAAELQLQQPHVVRMETRPASLEGKGEVNQRDLVKNALRMRPERIIIGEVRGSEAFDMLQAMNTGHDGSMSTIHANNTRDALTRVENMVQMGNMGLPSKAIKTQIVSAVDVIIQVERHRDGGRRVTQVTDVVGLEGDVVILNDLFQFEFTGESPEGRLAGTYKMGRGRPSFWERLVYFGMDRAWVAAMEETAW